MFLRMSKPEAKSIKNKVGIINNDMRIICNIMEVLEGIIGKILSTLDSSVFHNFLTQSIFGPLIISLRLGYLKAVSTSCWQTISTLEVITVLMSSVQKLFCCTEKPINNN